MVRLSRLSCSLALTGLLSVPLGVQAQEECGTVERLQISPVFTLDERIFVEAALCRAPLLQKQVLMLSGLAYDGARVKALWSRRYPIEGRVLAMEFEADGPASTLFSTRLDDGSALHMKIDLSTMELTDLGSGTLSRLLP